MSEPCQQGEQYLPSNMNNADKWNMIRMVLIGDDAVVVRRSDDGRGYCVRGVSDEEIPD